MFLPSRRLETQEVSEGPPRGGRGPRNQRAPEGVLFGVPLEVSPRSLGVLVFLRDKSTRQTRAHKSRNRIDTRKTQGACPGSPGHRADPVRGSPLGRPWVALGSPLVSQRAPFPLGAGRVGAPTAVQNGFPFGGNPSPNFCFCFPGGWGPKKFPQVPRGEAEGREISELQTGCSSECLLKFRPVRSGCLFSLKSVRSLGGVWEAPGICQGIILYFIGF